MGANTQDTGFTDLQATVDYLARATPRRATRRCRSTTPSTAWAPRVPAGPFAAGDTVTIPLDSLSMTGAG